MNPEKYKDSWRRRLISGVGLMLLTVILIPSIRAGLEEETTVHRVKAGDTLPRLCWQYKVRLEIIQSANPGVADPLAAGQRLVIPLGVTPTATAAVAPEVPVARESARPIPRAREVTVLRGGAVSADAVASAPAPHMEMAALARPAASSSASSVGGVTTVLPPPLPSVASSSQRTPRASARGRVEAPEAEAQPEENGSALPAPAVAQSTASAPPARRGVEGLDFLGESRRLAARGLRYNGSWTPPGQRSAWVMDCSNTSRYLYQAVAGIDIGRTASDQYYFLRQKQRAWDVPMGWDHKPKLDYLRGHLRVGDLLFWENTYKPVRKPDITHVMVFLGEDEQGRWQMAGSQTSRGVNIYRFDAQAPKGGYSSWFGLVHHEGRFVAYGRPLGGE